MTEFSPPTTIAQAFIERATKSPGDLAVVLITDDDQEVKISVGELRSRSEHFSRSLRDHGIKSADIVILALPHSFDLLAGFWGIQMIGAISTISNYKSPLIDDESYFEKVAAMVSQSGAHAILTIPEYQMPLKELVADKECVVISTNDEVSNGESEPEFLNYASIAPEKIAILQYSSGTQGLRKGVMLSQQAILNYLEIAPKARGLRETDVLVSWLPLYHDMGLITGFISPVIRGIPTILMSPFHWIQDPVVLFKAIDKYRGTIAYMPNFAFTHCVRAISDRDLEGLDLSYIRHLVNGAEPVDINSMKAFSEKFAPYGFKESALAVGYGLAENVLGVSRTRPGELPHVDWVNQRDLSDKQRAVVIPEKVKGAKPIVSCGFPLVGVEIQIIDDESEPLPERRVGEIIFRSSTLFSGYHRQAELTKQALREGWFYTGDLGYMVEGQLYVTGRKKDMIIVAGDNIYPQDIEEIANSINEIRPGRNVAFGITKTELGTERIVLVAELKQPVGEDEREAITRKLRRKVMEKLEVALSKVYLTDEQDWVVKTPSGKISRPANKEKYINQFGADNTRAREN